MAIMHIRQFGDQSLREKSKPVGGTEEETKQMLKDMAETMYNARGLGLSANQVGILKKVFIMDESAEGEKLKAYANPEIVEKEGEVEDEEGCLSLSEVRVPVKRYEKIKVRAVDLETGETVEIKAEGLEARIFQHEIDHLNGNLIIDRTSKEERKRALKELSFRDVPRL